MNKQFWVVSSLLISILGMAAAAYGVDTKDTRLLQQPAISKAHVAFFYDSDLWIANIDGSAPRRLTTAKGEESNATYSPDGTLIAFSANYDGNTDVYVMPVQGGVPKRLTWHPGSDVVLDFTPDGKAVLFRSARQVFTTRFTQLFTVPIEGGFPENLKIPNASKATFSPDGSRIAYTPLGERFNQWKNYRGGTVTRIWIYNVGDHAVVQIPQPKGRCNDTDPMWLGNKIYFRSDRGGEFNLFSYDVRSKSVKQLTQHADFPIVNASADDSKIIYEQAGYLHVFDPSRTRSSKLTVGVAAELLETRPRYVKKPAAPAGPFGGGPGGNPYIRNADVSPTGARAVFEFRGEIITVPAEKGDPRNLTQTAGVHERSPVWSPDGKQIAYFSDASGEYELHIQNRDAKGEVKKYKVIGNGFYDSPGWSPDGKKIAYVDNSKSLHWIDLESGVAKKIGQEVDPRGDVQFNWSHDSKWLTYTLNTKTYFRRVYVYKLDEDKSHCITDGLSDVSSPVFDPSGKYLYFLASTDAGPVRQWFDMSKADMEMTSSIYLAVLRDDLPNPLFKESDEEGAPEKKQPEQNKSEEPEPLIIDFEGLNERIVDIPLPARAYSNLQVGNTGQIYFLERQAGAGGGRFGGASSELKRYDLSKRNAEDLASGLSGYQLTVDKKKLFYYSRNAWGIAPAGQIKPGQGKLNTDALQVKIDPRQEWEQIFNEAWRINRDYFYATNFHGADWEAMRTKYSQLLPHLATRSDLNRVIQWMCSELAVGHHRVSGGDRLEQPERVGGGLLGADYAVENGHYRFKTIYGGLNWNPQLRSPLTEPGVRVKEGEYLLAVEGMELLPPTNIFSMFENTADKIIEITVGPNPDGTGSRTVKVVPIGSESAMRNRDWVEGNVRKVDEATNGRVAYVYVPNTSTSGHTYFKRYFYPQAYKDAIIVDERFNGGGSVADYYIDHLRKQEISYWHMRYGQDLKTPSASIQGPKVMIIDETAGSGGDLLPWMFRKFKLGKLVGRPTWGGLVGTLGFPPLMDGGRVAAPNLAIWTEDGWIVENVGVPPDIEVEQWPADVIAGRDPQLEKAIEVVMDELKKNPPKKPKRPPFPVRNPRGKVVPSSGKK